MRTALLLLLAFATAVLSSTAVAADVWKWVDAKGVTHYSDTPVPGATKIEVSAGNVVSAPPGDTFSPSTASTAQQPAFSYSTLAITRPENNQALINTAGQVDVDIQIEPGLQQQHTLNLLLDGTLVEGFPRNAQSYELKNIPRGTHNVTATVTDRSGLVIAKSAPVTFTVRQESIAQPPVGPSVRPPPKPRPNNKTSNKMHTTQPSYGTLNGSQPAIDPATNLPVVKQPAPKPGKP